MSHRQRNSHGSGPKVAPVNIFGCVRTVNSGVRVCRTVRFTGPRPAARGRTRLYRIQSRRKPRGIICRLATVHATPHGPARSSRFAARGRVSTASPVHAVRLPQERLPAGLGQSRLPDANRRRCAATGASRHRAANPRSHDIGAHGRCRPNRPSRPGPPRERKHRKAVSFT